MAATITSRFAASLRRWCASRNPNPMSRGLLAPPLLPSEASARAFSSVPHGREDALSEDSIPQPEGDLRSRIFRLRFPKRSATAALERWVEEGGKVTAPELRQIARELRRAQRYKHALEICEWMITHQKVELTGRDYADRIDLITKVFGVGAAEEFFEGLPASGKTSETYTTLLHSFARAKMIEKAESFFVRMKESNLILSALPYNEMMTLYISAGQLDKVSIVAEELKSNGVSSDLYTYNLRISACAATLDIDGVRRILNEMHEDTKADSGWMTYSKLTEIYISAGHLVYTENSLVEAEKKISQRDWITYDFLILLHAGLGNKERIGEIWNSLKMTSQKMTSRNYICVLSTYIMLGQLEEAGEIIDEWKQLKSLDFDISACNRIFEALIRVGLNSTAEVFHQLMHQKNCELTCKPE